MTMMMMMKKKKLRKKRTSIATPTANNLLLLHSSSAKKTRKMIRSWSRNAKCCSNMKMTRSSSRNVKSWTWKTMMLMMIPKTTIVISSVRVATIITSMTSWNGGNVSYDRRSSDVLVTRATVRVKARSIRNVVTRQPNRHRHRHIRQIHNVSSTRHGNHQLHQTLVRPARPVRPKSPVRRVKAKAKARAKVPKKSNVRGMKLVSVLTRRRSFYDALSPQIPKSRLDFEGREGAKGEENGSIDRMMA
mmetsp:Transcript_29931/g.72552  ORF Transcript_29931/g.72552 Transcript_29931/m.72552 type:complete len:246 (+) Transcript_29931:176-913(+)